MNGICPLTSLFGSTGYWRVVSNFRVINSTAAQVGRRSQLKSVAQRTRVAVLLPVLVIALRPDAAVANLVSNPGFETFTGTVPNSGVQLVSTSTELANWNVTGGEIAILDVPNNWALTPSEGNNFLDLTGYTSAGFPKGIYQTVAGLTTGGHYTLSLDVGISNGNASCGNCGGPVQVNAAIGTTAQTFTHSSTETGNIWGRYGFEFTATAPDMLLTITGVSVPAGAIYIGLDNISIEAVPVPAAAWLFGGGLLGLTGVLRRRRTS